MKIYQLLIIEYNDEHFETQRLVKISNDLDNLKRYVYDYYNLSDYEDFCVIDERDSYPQLLYGKHFVEVTYFDI